MDIEQTIKVQLGSHGLMSDPDSYIMLLSDDGEYLDLKSDLNSNLTMQDDNEDIDEMVGSMSTVVLMSSDRRLEKHWKKMDLLSI